MSRTLAAGISAVGGVFLALTLCAPDLSAADLNLSGNLLGSVVNAEGLPQMSAQIQLFDHLGNLAHKALSSEDGRFAFPNLPADSYSVWVSSSDYLPAKLSSVPVRPGVNSILEIHLASILSSIQLTYALPGAAMSKDWRLVLRSSPATRPINRLQAEQVSISQGPEASGKVFSQTRAVVSLSGGDVSLADADSLADVGTGFAVSTNILQKNRLQVGGSMAQNSGGLVPAAMGLSAVYSRQGDDTFDSLAPEVTFSISQLGLLSGGGMTLPGGQVPAVRTMSLSVYKVLDVGGLTRLEYGVTSESVDYLEHTTRVSPFARATTSLGTLGDVIMSYSDGARPDALRAHQQDANSAFDEQDPNQQLTNSVSSLSRIPQLSYRNGRLELERTESYEIGWQKLERARTYALSAFAEQVANGRLDASGNTSLLNAGNLMSDGTSATLLYNIGNYRRNGVVASVNQRIKTFLDISLAAGRMQGFTAQSGSAGDGLDAFLNEQSHWVANAAVHLRAPKSLTRLSANYAWSDDNAIMPFHAFTTQNTVMSPGLNVLVRQPLPSLFGMPGHLELSADLRNLLAQGYLPIANGDGHSLVMLQAPRAIRGGLNFIF